MFISDKEVRSELDEVFSTEASLSEINTCVPILRGGDEILQRIPSRSKENWKIYPITVRSYSDELKKQENHTYVNIPEKTLNFLLHEYNKHSKILVLDDIYHTGKTLKILQSFLEFNESYNSENVYYLIFVNKSVSGNNYLYKLHNTFWVRNVKENDWVEFEWERNRNQS